MGTRCICYKASNSGGGDSFGKSIAIDGNNIVVGAWYEDSSDTTIKNTDGEDASSQTGKTNSGALYVLKKDASGNWIQDAYIKTDHIGNASEHFGTSVDISENTIVAGAPGDDNIANNSGAVYIFRKESTDSDSDGDLNWEQEGGRIKASNIGAGDNFGSDIAIDNDVIVVGSWNEDSGYKGVINTNNTTNESTLDSSNSGAVYVFKKDSSGDWYQDAYIKASNADTDTTFGHSVGINGKVIVVGAFGEDSNAQDVTNTDGEHNDGDNTAGNSGAVYVFKEDKNGNWIQDSFLKASNSDAGDQFGAGRGTLLTPVYGNSVGVSGDTIAVGARNEKSDAQTIENNDNTASASNTSGDYTGAVYIFENKAN